jgi:hypothetical protein
MMLGDVPVTSIIRLSLVLVGLILAGWVTVWQVRRRLTKPDETSGTGFTLSDLRQLHKSGQMSDAEFERAKAKVVEAARRASEREQVAAAGRARSAAGTAANRQRPTRLPPDNQNDL